MWARSGAECHAALIGHEETPLSGAEGLRFGAGFAELSSAQRNCWGEKTGSPQSRATPAIEVPLGGYDGLQKNTRVVEYAFLFCLNF